MSEVATTIPETTNVQTYKIVNLKANNFLKLRAIDITPGNEQVIQISGPNGAGKSSVLKAIYAAFAHAEISKTVKTPIRTGEASGSVSVDLGDIVVTRHWTDNETYLQVENGQGLVYKSPQTMLNKIKTSLTFDPLAFTRLSPAEQRATLIRLLGIDIDWLDQDRSTRYTTRTEINRRLKEAEGKLGAYQMVPANTPDEPVSSLELIQQIRNAQEKNSRIEALKNQITKRRDEIERLEKALLEERQYLNENEKDLGGMTFTDTSPLENRLSEVETINRDVDRKRQQCAIMNDIEALSKKSDDLTEEIEGIDQKKRDVLTSAAFPVPGLSVESSGVLFNGIPLSQASAAEKIRISCAIGMAMKPDLRVMLIEDGSLLDSTSRQVIEDMARGYGMQVWIEMVDETGSCGIIIEDGEVKTSGEVAG